jgi:hypothetical protein
MSSIAIDGLVRSVSDLGNEQTKDSGLTDFF